MLFSTLQLSVRCIRGKVLRTQNIKTQIQMRMYKDWAHRKPVAIINEEIDLDEGKAAPKPRKYVAGDEEHRPLRTRPRRSGQHPKKPIANVRSDGTFKEDGTPNMIRLADNDRTLATLMMTLKSRKLREKNSLILLEGQRLISDAIQAGLEIEAIVCSRTSDVLKLQLPDNGIKLYHVPYKTIQLWSSLTNSPGIMAIFKTPETFEKKLTQDVIPLTIICDNVREPGNLGSILRAAAGVGCERVILTKGCVDVWEQKVLRTAAGAHFRISIRKSVGWNAIKSQISPAAKIFAADNNVEVNPELLSDSEQPSDPALVQEDSSTSSDDEFEREYPPYKGDHSGAKSVRDDLPDAKIENGTMQKVSLKELANRLPIIPYYAVDYTTNEVVLIVGGETEGLSLESIQLLQQNQGIRVNVPLINGVESLNTGMALGIVAFEVRRQFVIKRAASAP